MSKSKAKFKLQANFQPAGDQPAAIRALLDGLKRGESHQTLLGVTGSGKTFTMANVIADYGRPTLVIAHNKTLAAQLAQEYRGFFPHNAVHYFVSYYDYYQPEAYIAATDTYIEKDAKINQEIDRLRHASTQALLTRRDVIIVASVSCIYGLGSPETYLAENRLWRVGEPLERADLLRDLVHLHYERTTSDLGHGQFRALGNRVEIMPPNELVIYQMELEAGRLATVAEIDPVSRARRRDRDELFIFPAKHFVTTEQNLRQALVSINRELDERLSELRASGRLIEADRLLRRTKYDLALLREVGYCNGIENYSRHLEGRTAGAAPSTLLSYFPRTEDGRPDFLTIIDESHVTLPQLSGMLAGDQSRKTTLVEYGFRLPSARDNRPLSFEEFNQRVGKIIYTSATPADYERGKSGSRNIIEQIIRPTGLPDPVINLKPITGTKNYPGQIKDFIAEAEKAIGQGGRVIATTLTKKMAEDLSAFLTEQKIKASYLHSEIKTLERIKILTDFRKGKFDCLVGVNLLREGLDLPEVSLIGILDADKEGFLRSPVSLIQIIGRAARNVAGRVILYADRETTAIKQAVEETARRRQKQLAYNQKHGITPLTIKKLIRDITEELESEQEKTAKNLLALELKTAGSKRALIKQKKEQMAEAVRELDFETAAIIRDELKILENSKDKKKIAVRQNISR